MKNFFQKRGLRAQVFLILGCEVVLLLAIAGIVVRQVRWIEAKITEMADLKDPSPFTGGLVQQLNTMNLNLLGYTHTRDDAALQRIADSQKRFENSLVEYHHLNPRLFPETSQTKISHAYQPFKNAIQNVLRSTNEQSEKWGELLDNNEKVNYLLEHRLRPLIHGDQPMAIARMDLVLNLETQVRTIPKDLTQYIFRHTGESEMQMDENDKKFERLLKVYQRYAVFASERKVLNVVDGLWFDNMGIAQDLVKFEKAKSTALNNLLETNQTLQSTISEVLPAVRPEIIEQKKEAIFRAITWMLVIAGFIILLAIFSCVASAVSIYRRIRRSMDELRQAADAAAKGEIAPPMQPGSHELGDVTRSVNKLIGALRRSEELNMQLGTIVESSGDASIGVTFEGHILSWNRGAYRMYGYTVEEIKGKSIETLFAAQQEVALIKSKLAQAKQFAFDTFHIRKNGNRIQVHVIATPILDSKGTRIGISLLSRELRNASSALPPLDAATPQSSN